MAGEQRGDALEERGLRDRPGGRQQAVDRPLDPVGERDGRGLAVVRGRRATSARARSRSAAAGSAGPSSSRTRASTRSTGSRGCVRSAAQRRGPGRTRSGRVRSPAGSGPAVARPCGRRAPAARRPPGRRRSRHADRVGSLVVARASPRAAAGVGGAPVAAIAARAGAAGRPGRGPPGSRRAAARSGPARRAPGAPRPRLGHGPGGLRRRERPRVDPLRRGEQARPGTRSGSPAPPGERVEADVARASAGPGGSDRARRDELDDPADLVVGLGQPRLERAGSRRRRPPSTAATSASGPPSTSRMTRPSRAMCRRDRLEGAAERRGLPAPRRAERAPASGSSGSSAGGLAAERPARCRGTRPPAAPG